MLPTDAGQQRIQLARRLAAEDSSIDLMSIDPPYTAEFANAGFLAPIPARPGLDRCAEQSFRSALAAATWKGKLVVAPFWSNTQVLWYRKSFVEKAGIDMSKPVTWDQIIDAAADNGGTVGGAGQQVRGLRRLDQRPRRGRRREILITDADKGADADDRASSSTAGRDAADGDRGAGPLQGRRRRTCRCPTRAPPAPPSAAPKGAFMVNWTYIFHNYDTDAPRGGQGHRLHDATRRRVPGARSGRRTAGSASASASTPSHVDWHSRRGLPDLVSHENQGVNAEITGNMPASAAGYDVPAAAEDLPREPAGAVPGSSARPRPGR